MGYEQQQKPASATGTMQKQSVPSAGAGFARHGSQRPNGILQKKSESAATSTPLPDRLKAGVERLSGFSMEDVRVHWNSPEPERFQAHAYASGSDIHLGRGQEQHLPHEAWHVVQQKQGRVEPTTVQAHGAPLNDDPGLEQEADRMGALAARSAHHDPPRMAPLSMGSGALQRQVVQRKKVASDFGEFETTKFSPYDGRGVEIELKFHPDETKVDATKIALIQSVKSTLENGNAYGLDPNVAGRMVPSGKSGAGYTIDQFSDLNTPIYSENKNLGATQNLEDTPFSRDTSNGEMGYCYKEKPEDAAKKKHFARLWDRPEGKKSVGRSKMFESTALAIAGANKDTYYGSVTWGYKIEGTAAAPTLTTFDIDIASKGTPTSNFTEAAKLWNAAKTRGTIEVTADPEATVLKGDASGTEKMAKGTKLKQLETVTWGTDPAIKAEVLKADGTGSGKMIYIKNSDVKDSGNGGDTKDLPIPK